MADVRGFCYLCVPSKPPVMSIRVASFTFNPFMENTYVLHNTKVACIIDPGCCNPQEENMLQDYVQKNNLSVAAILNTHCHIDHVLGNAFCKDTWHAPLHIPWHEQALLAEVQQYAPAYGINNYRPTTPDAFLKEGQSLPIGSCTLQVLYTPGHSPGHVVFYEPSAPFLMGGDVLFFRSIGRTDLPGGNHEQLIESIHKKVFVLPESTKVYPGHGEPTTIGDERRLNPFCALSHE